MEHDVTSNDMLRTNMLIKFQSRCSAVFDTPGHHIFMSGVDDSIMMARF